MFRTGGESSLGHEEAFLDPHNLASCVKLWLRELPEIVPGRFYFSFIQANGKQFPGTHMLPRLSRTSDTDGYEERLYAIRNLIWQLPSPSFNLLKRLSEHLYLVSEHELENQMHAANLAIVFAPTIFRPPDAANSYGLLSTFFSA
jgi:hypothetical protein